jgi:putative DNA primase/helicase
LLTLLAAMVNRAIVASNISPPALFRVIEEAQPTLLIDEADTFLQGNEELRGILNAGYSQETAYVVRVASREQNLTQRRKGPEAQRGSLTFTEGNKENEGEGTSSQLVKFSCWCPKVMAAIGRLPETLADRCIIITMQRKSGNERCERLRSLDATDLRRRCARFVEDNREKIATWQPAIPEKLNDRAADIWEPLLALAELAGGDWPSRARAAAEKLSGSREENTRIGLLLLYIQALFRDSGQERHFSRTVVRTINQFEDRPWEEERKGKPIDELWLSRQLKPYGIHPRTVWINGETARGYHREDFEDVFGRYAPPLPEDLKRWLAGGEWETSKNAECKGQNAEGTE